MKLADLKHTPLRCTLIVGIVLFVLACSELAPEKPLRIGTNTWIGYESLYLAQHRQLLPPDALSLQRMNNTTEVMAAFERGDLDAAGVTLDEAMLLLEKGVKLKLAMILDISNGADKLLARPEISAISQLKGRIVGVEQTAVGALLLHSALTSEGLTLNDISILPSTIDQLEDLYLTGKVDAVVCFDPVALRLGKRGARLLYDSSRMTDIKIVDVLIVTPELATQRTDQLNALLDSVQHAMILLQKHDANALAFVGTNLKLPKTEWPHLLNGITLGNSHFTQNQIKREQMESFMWMLDAIMVENGLLKRSVSAQIEAGLLLW